MIGFVDDHSGRLERRLARARMRKKRRAVFLGISIIVISLAIGGAWLGFTRNEKVEKPRVYRVVVPEGLNIKQTARKVSSQCKISYEAFLEAAKGHYEVPIFEGSAGNLEGFLFPKTYEVTSNTSARELIKKMLNQFFFETSNLDWSIATSKGFTKYQVLIIASLVEKEAKFPDERPIIASVIYNRLSKNMKLQIDATVQYALGEWKPALTYDDLKVNSPYNTYIVSGLPPSPICSPGLDSISAAINPAQTDYIYYLLTSQEGRHSFTSDYKQFLQWKKEAQSNR